MILLIGSRESNQQVLISAEQETLTEQSRFRGVRAFKNSFNEQVTPESLNVIDFLETKGRKTMWHKCFSGK